jgi:cell division protein FtsW
MIKFVEQYFKGDRAIWLIAFFLCIASLLLVYSSISTLAYKYHGGNTAFYLIRHGFFLAGGLGIMYLIHKVRYAYFSRISQLLLYISIPLLLITLVLGSSINEASRWLQIPFINQTFQTSDLAKLALITYVARMLTLKKDVLGDFNQGVLPILIPVVLVCALIFPANFSTAALLFGSSFILMFIGGVKLKHLGSIVGVALLAVIMSYFVAKSAPDLFPRMGTWISRIENFNEPSKDGNYQVEQSKIAIANGGIARLAPGKSIQRNFLPHPYSDFIFAIVIEEYGMLGGMFILALYMILFIRALRIVRKCKQTFGAYLVLGITFMLVFQALVNMAVAVNLFPVTGQPLPLVSMGGTSMWFTCIGIGIVLSVSAHLEEVDMEEDLIGKNVMMDAQA